MNESNPNQAARDGEPSPVENQTPASDALLGGGTVGGEMEHGADAHAPGTNGAEGPATPHGPGAVEDALLGLSDDVERDLPACTCGKPPGQGGQHKKSCARRHDVVSSHGAAPVLPGPGVAGAGAVAVVRNVVRPEPVATHADHSFYGKTARRFYKRRVEFAQKSKVEKWEPLFNRARGIGLTNEVNEVAAMIEDGAISADDLDELEKAMTEVAQEENWPKVHPLARVGIIIADWELSNLFRNIVLNKNFAKLTAAVEGVATAQEERKAA